MATNTHMTNDGDDHGKMMMMMMDEEEAFCYGMILASGAVLPMVVNAMIDLDVFEIIKRAGPGTHLSPIEIADRLPGPTRNPDAPVMLDRILRLLATHSIVSCLSRTRPDGRVERVYGLGPVCKFLNKNEEGINCGAVSLVNHDKVLMESWYHLKEAIMEGGISFNKAHGKGVFEYAGSDPIFNKIFNNAMTKVTNFAMEKVLDNYKGFEGISTVVDVGGNIGASLSMIVARYPNIKGINFDLPHVVNNAPTCPGVEHIGGNMFESVPTGDAIFMKFICHDWSDEHCMKLLKNCYDALPDHGKVINCDLILPSTPKNSQEAKLLFQMDVLMMSNTNGKERTTQEFETLAKAAGFQVFRVVFSTYQHSIMEFLKNK